MEFGKVQAPISTQAMAEHDVKHRFKNVVSAILSSLKISQMELGQKYLDVSQSCVRDYLSGRISPLSVKTGTMIKISNLYGVSIDALIYYLINGKWKRGLTYQELESNIRSITDVRMLAAMSCMISDLLKSRIDEMTEESTMALIPSQRNARLIDALEQERETVGNETQWTALLQAFDITEAEIANLHSGTEPTFEFLLRLSKLLRQDIEELRELVKDPTEAPLVSHQDPDNESLVTPESNGL